MLAILAPILVFGLVIFVHELGHFIAAKAVGVYAPRFSIGFGPSIFRFRRGETEYILAWLPLGGYVRMASRHDAETAFLEGVFSAPGQWLLLEATPKRAIRSRFEESGIPCAKQALSGGAWER